MADGDVDVAVGRSGGTGNIAWIENLSWEPEVTFGADASRIVPFAINPGDVVSVVCTGFRGVVSLFAGVQTSSQVFLLEPKLNLNYVSPVSTAPRSCAVALPQSCAFRIEQTADLGTAWLRL